MSIHEKAKVREEQDGGVTVKVIQNCARCGGSHEHVKFNKFTNGMFIERAYNYWAMCPTLNEPIIMARVSDSDTSDIDETVKANDA